MTRSSITARPWVECSRERPAAASRITISTISSGYSPQTAINLRGRSLLSKVFVEWMGICPTPSGFDIWMGTLSKTLAGCGGFIAGSADLVDYIKSLVGVFVYSVGMPPVIVAAAKKALDILHREPHRVSKLQQNAATFHAIAKAKGLNVPSRAIATAVNPVLIGDSISAVVLSHRLLEQGVNVLPVLYPAVPANAARLRFFLTAMHSDADIEKALALTVEELAKIPDTMRALHIPGY